MASAGATLNATGTKAPRIENAAGAFLRRFSPTDSITEWLLTSPDGFGVQSATPAQRAVCRILDGAPLGDLEDHPDVAELLGGSSAVDSLPGCKPVEACLTAGIRAAKTFMACAAAIRMALTVEVAGIRSGEAVRVPIVSLTLKNATDAYTSLSRTVTGSSVLRPLLVDEPTAGALKFRHPSGRTVEIAVAAGKKAGGSLVGIWLAGVVFDEAPRMDGAEDAVVNLDHARTAAVGRLLNGAQALYIGSPWAPHGPIYDMVQKHHGHPSARIVVMRGTGPMFNPVWWTPERMAAQPPATFQTDVLGEFADPEGGLFNVDSLQRSVRRGEDGKPLVGDLPYEIRGDYFAAMDPSDGAAESNPWTLVIVQRRRRAVAALTPDGEPALNRDGSRKMEMANTFRVVATREWRGTRPGDAVAEAAKLCRAYGLRSAVTDQYAGEALADLASQHGFVLKVEPWTRARKVQAFIDLSTLLDSDCVELSGDPQLMRDLMSVRKRTTQNGVQIVFPKMGDGRHCDYAPALASAVEAGNSTPHTIGLYSSMRARQGQMPKPRE